MGKIKDLGGMTFGLLVAVEMVGLDKHKKAKWRCVCECGSESVVTGADLLSGKTKSCKCRRNELNRNRPRTHGLSRHKLFPIWANMRQRCQDPNSGNYYRYGGRGISVCAQWDNSFLAFYDFCIENGWKEGLQIDRIDNNGDYAPDNFRWTDQKSQVRNRRVTCKVELDGRMVPAPEYAEMTGESINNVYKKYYKRKNVPFLEH